MTRSRALNLAFFLGLSMTIYACSSDSTPNENTTGSGTSSDTGMGAQTGSGGAVSPASGGGSGAGTSSSGGASASGGNGGGMGAGPGSGGGDQSASGGSGCIPANGDQGAAAPVDEGKPTFVYIGSGSWGGDDGLISVYTLDRSTRTLTFVSDHPAGGLASSMAVDETAGRLYAGDEGKKGVNSFTIDKTTGSLTSLGATASNNAPVFVTLTPGRDYLLAANYEQGNVDVYPIGTDGKAGASAAAVPSGMQAHCVRIDPQNHVLVTNKGSNTISHFNFASGTLSAGSPASAALESPRHIFWQGTRAYVVSETADLITAFDVGTDGSLTKSWDVPRLAGGNAGTDTGADIHVTSDGRFLYASNRGTANNIVAYDLQGCSPTLLEHEPTLGTTPRNFALDPLDQFIIVANQDSGSVVIFDIAADGKLDHATTLDVDYSPFFVAISRF